jgi:hypothetical protein
VNLLYSVQTVALACVFIATARSGQTIGEKIVPLETCFSMFKQRKVRLNATVDKDTVRAEFESLPWQSKIDDRVDPNDLVECISTIAEFYKTAASMAFPA